LFNAAIFAGMIYLNDIHRLFDDLWPAMHASTSHKHHCINSLFRIENCFKKWGNNYNFLLDGLSSLDGIGLTIASGLIWSTDPVAAVPFDKFTMTYALTERILRNEHISGGHYATACQKIVAYCEDFTMTEANGIERGYEVKDFVREAREKMIDFPGLLGPK
jgi:hypothetical protein